MIKIIMVKHKTLKYQQKQTAQPVIGEQSHYQLSVSVLCILRQVPTIMVITFLSALNEQILIKFVISHSIITDFQI